jgi:Protein of unknown function (DUF1194)
MQRFGLVALLVLGIVFEARASRAAEVDRAIVLAVDVSGSVNEERYRLQMQGYSKAFRSPEVVNAITNGVRHAIAVTLVEWSAPNEQMQMIEWTVIDGEASARSFAIALAEIPRAFSSTTSISGAINYAVELLETCPHDTRRKVIDVSGDGANNAGRPVDEARDAAIARGITINGLPILADEAGVDTHYRAHVVGGPGAFLIVANGFGSFAEAILRKLVLEIAAAPPAGSGFAPID